MPHLDRSFFQRDPATCARELVGCGLVWGKCAGIVVETEAYSEHGDEACHTFTRPSAREFIARRRAGAAYVYFNYGMYWLLNVLVKDGAVNGFVLIRAIEPVRGVELMTRRRDANRKTKIQGAHSLCSGPGKLAVALAIDGSDHGRDLCRGDSVGFLPGETTPEIVADGRIGISKAAHLPWRFTLRGSAYVSIKPRAGDMDEATGRALKNERVAGLYEPAPVREAPAD